jgi:hypothetical protein
VSRVTVAINKIAKDLDKISGLDGVVADYLEMTEKKIAMDVKYILDNHPESNLFDYYGQNKEEK